jgi:hypothetical protein
MSVIWGESSTFEVADGAAVLCRDGSSLSKVGGGLDLVDCDISSPVEVAKGPVVVICGGTSPLGVAKDSMMIDYNQKHQQQKSMLLQLEAVRREGNCKRILSRRCQVSEKLELGDQLRRDICSLC